MTMNPGAFVLISGSLAFGVPLFLAWREFRTFGSNKDDGGSPPDNGDPNRRPPNPDLPRKAATPKALPDCLIPKLAARAPDTPVREPELA